MRTWSSFSGCPVEGDEGGTLDLKRQKKQEQKHAW